MTMSLLDQLQQYLCPAGEGVYTVHTAQDMKNQIQQVIYKAQGETVVKVWQQHLMQLLNNTKPLVLGICSDTGGGILRGANWGPLFVRRALYREVYPDAVFDLGDVRVVPHLLSDSLLNDATLRACRKALYADPKNDLAVSPLSITEAVAAGLNSQLPASRIFALGGDHSVSYPLVKAFIEAKQAAGKRIAIIHFDAHTDLLDSRLGIDICFGTWAYHILPLLHSPAQFYQIGIRSSGQNKAYWEKTCGINQYWAYEIKQHGVDAIIQKILAKLTQQNIDELYISFDIDAIDSSHASATGTPEPNGLLPDEAIAMIKALQHQYPVTGADLMEVAPFVSYTEDHTGTETTLNTAGMIAAQLIRALKISA